MPGTWPRLLSAISRNSHPSICPGIDPSSTLSFTSSRPSPPTRSTRSSPSAIFSPAIVSKPQPENPLSGLFMICYSPSLLHQLVIEAGRAHKAPGDGAAVSVDISFLTSHRPPSDRIIQGGGLPTTPIILAVPPAKLAALRDVDAVKSYFGAPDLQRIAINDDCVP